MLPNHSARAITYAVSLQRVPGVFEFLASVALVTVPVGETGVVGIMLIPTGDELPPPGTQVPFTVELTNTETGEK
jgi:hypothetical protein